MKRFFPGAALLLTLALTACTPSPDAEASRAAELPYTEGQLYAAAWLGWQGTGDLSRYADLCPGIEEAPVLHLSDGEAEFSPSISLRDGSVVLGPEGLDLTRE